MSNVFRLVLTHNNRPIGGVEVQTDRTPATAEGLFCIFAQLFGAILGGGEHFNQAWQNFKAKVEAPCHDTGLKRDADVETIGEGCPPPDEMVIAMLEGRLLPAEVERVKAAMTFEQRRMVRDFQAAKSTPAPSNGEGPEPA